MRFLLRVKVHLLSLDLENHMKYKLLGNTGLRVSELCLGAMTFGEEWGFGADKDECRKVFETFAEAGGNFIDTANKYTEGTSEKWLGEFVKEARERFVIATKYTLTMGNGDPNASGNHRKNMVQAVEASLKRLNMDYIDLLWVHAWDFTTSPEVLMRGLDDLVRQGKVLHVGISDAPAWVVAQCNTIALMRGWTPFSALQIEYSLIERTVERELLPMVRAFDMTVTPWAPLGGGLLTGKFTRSSAEPDSKRIEQNKARMSERNVAIAKAVDKIADELEVTSAQVATNWVRQQGTNIIPIVGSRKASQIADTVKSLSFELSTEQLQILNEVSQISLGFPHEFIERDFVRNIVYGDLVEQIERPTLRF